MVVICHVIVGVGTHRDVGVSPTAIRCVGPGGYLPRAVPPFCDGRAVVDGMKLGDRIICGVFLFPPPFFVASLGY